MPIEPRDGIEANGTTREIGGDGRKQSGVAQDRRPSQICRLERVAGRGIIAPRRKRSAHLHRPWRAIFTEAEPLRRARMPRETPVVT
jgi:hypothetical protein